jgi:hypothetical protein
MADPSPTATEFTDTDHEEMDQFDISSKNLALVAVQHPEQSDHHYRQIVSEFKPPTVETNRNKSNIIMTYHIKTLSPGMFQLERECCDWDAR